MLVRRSLLRTALGLGAVLGAGTAAHAATIEGQIAFPGQAAPPLTAYACEVDTSRIHTAPVAAGQARFSFELPVGRYIVFLAPREAGAPDIYGAHTRYSLCMANAAAAPAGGGACTDHRLADVTLGTRTARAQLNIDDWALTDDIDAHDSTASAASKPDGAAEPLAARASRSAGRRPARTPSAPKPDAGDIALATGRTGQDCNRRWPGTELCRHAEHRPGAMRQRLRAPAAARLARRQAAGASERRRDRGPLPCRTDESIVFPARQPPRRHHEPAYRRAAVTRYLVWKPESATLQPVAEYQRTVESFCAALPP